MRQVTIKLIKEVTYLFAYAWQGSWRLSQGGSQRIFGEN